MAHWIVPKTTKEPAPPEQGCRLFYCRLTSRALPGMFRVFILGQ